MTYDPEIVKSRLRQALQESTYTQEVLASAVGVSKQSVGKWLKTGQISLENLATTASILGVSVDWIVGATESEPSTLRRTTVSFKIQNALKEPKFYLIVDWESPENLPEGQFAFVPRYKIQVAGDNGGIVFEVQREDRGQTFRTEWLKRKGLRSRDLACIKAEDSSMKPRIREGDKLLVNLNDDTRRLEDGKVYVIRYGDEVRVRRLYKLPAGGLIIHPDNDREFLQVRLAADELNGNIEVVGRVIWVGGEI